MSAYIRCRRCGEDTLDVDTQRCDCATNIVTKLDPKPIPDRRWDWDAHLAEFDPERDPVGHGPTEFDAIRDLFMELEAAS